MMVSRVVVVALGAAGGASLTPMVAGQTIAEIIDASGDGAGQLLAKPTGIAIDASGGVYVAGLISNNVFKVDANGAIHLVVDSSGDGIGNLLEGAANPYVDSNGDLFIVGDTSDNVFKIEAGGAVSMLIDSQGDGAGNGLDAPVDVAVDFAGNVFVPGVLSNNVFKITPSGVVTQIIDAAGDGLGAVLAGPRRVDVDNSGNVYVVAGGSDNVFRISPDGVVTEILNGTGDGTGNTLDGPWGIAVSESDNIYVSGFFSKNVFRVEPDGSVSEIFETPPGPFGEISEIAVGGSEAVYFSIFHDVLRLASDGTTTSVIDTAGDGLGNILLDVSGIAVGDGGNVYVSGQLSDNAFRIACGPPTTSTTFSYNGSDINLDTLLASPAISGSDWTATIDPIFVRGPGSWILLLRGESSSGTLLDLGTLLGLPAAGNSELLVNLASPFGTTFFPAPHTGGGSTATFTAQVPYSCSLVGQSWYAQAIVTGALPTGPGSFDPWFSSAVGGVVGNQ